VDPLFSQDEIEHLEQANPAGISAATVLELLSQRGLVISEATFRKYVQLGLLPRSKRVGRKGKHRGSHGLYPAGCVALVADIRARMGQGLTLEDLQRSELAVGMEVEQLRRLASGVLARLDGELERRQAAGGALPRRLEALRARAAELADGLEAAARAVCSAGAPAQGARPDAGAARRGRGTEKERRP